MSEPAPCPRVNTWAVGYPPGPWITSPGNFILTQPGDSPESGVDIFYWKGRDPYIMTEPAPGGGTVVITIPGRRPQRLNFTATENPIIEISDAGDLGDQVKHSIRYTKPGNYQISVSIENYI